MPSTEGGRRARTGLIGPYALDFRASAAYFHLGSML